MYNKKILAKALSDIAKKETSSKYKICAIKGNIYILYGGIALYPTLNYIGLSISNPDITFYEKTLDFILGNISNDQEIQLSGYNYKDLTEFITANGEKVYCKTDLLKDIDNIKYNYYTYVIKNKKDKFICVYDDPAKNYLYAVMCPVVIKE
jgi:hypothetical protein